MGPYLINPDRATRRDAEAAVAGFFEQNESHFDEIYDRLVKVRNRIARKLGFENLSASATPGSAGQIIPREKSRLSANRWLRNWCL